MLKQAIFSTRCLFELGNLILEGRYREFTTITAKLKESHRPFFEMKIRIRCKSYEIVRLLIGHLNVETFTSDRQGTGRKSNY